MQLNSLNKYSQIVIQVHDNPDADAVGSGYALYKYFKAQGKDVRLVYGGRFAITKSNMKLLLAELDIPLEYIRELPAPELLLTVDCQYGEGNVQKFPAQNVAMIDHHSTGRLSDENCEIRSHLISCATICYSMLKDAGFDINSDISVSTALYYGLFMDSNQLSEINHPLDRDMMDFLQYDKMLVTRLKYANFNIDELATAGFAITNNSYIEKHRTAIVRSEPCDPNILGVIGDFVIQVDTIDVCIIYNDCAGGLKLSVRSCTPAVAANDLADFVTAGIGNGGGHFTKAGGFINIGKFVEKYPELTVEDYFFSRMDEYYRGYDVINYTDEIAYPEKLLRYRKKPAAYGYVVSSEICKAGTDCKIRTLEGDVLITASDDTYIMIGIFGEAYPIEKAVFETKYTPTGEPFTKEFEYDPTVINMSEGTTENLMLHARQCMSGAGAIVMARPLERFTKVFTHWNYETYMSGSDGDMLCYTDGNSRDVYIARRDMFDAVYELVTE